MTNRTSEVTRTRGWVKYLAVSCTALLLAACSSGLNADVPTQPELAPQASSCLNRSGKKIKLKNNQRGRVFRQRNVVVDGRGVTVRDNKNPFVGSYNKGFLCISGGTYGANMSVSASWGKSHSSHGMYFADNQNLTVQNVAVGVGGKIVGDGFAIKQKNQNFRIEHSYVGRAGDDGVENDRFNDGTVDNILVDSAFTGLSCRREGNSYTKIRSYNFNVKNSLISLKGRSNDLFKVTTRGKNYCKLNLSNNVFYLPNRDGGKIERKVLNGGSCRNNTIVYTGGSKSYLNYLKRNSSSCFKITTDKRVWEKARDAWFKRHSEFARYR